MAHALTAVRLGLVLPVAWAFAQPALLAPHILFALVCLAIATDYADGKVARAAVAGHVTLILPPLIVVAFGQYVLDSYYLYRQKQLRMSAIGRWNGVLYFVPLVLVSASGLGILEGVAGILMLTARIGSYVLSVATVVSVIDRASAPLRRRR